MAASTHVITDTTTCVTNGQTTLSQADAINPSNKIQDALGNTNGLLLHFKECLNLANLILTVTDPGDPNYALLQNIILTLS
jgi:hypothetical protein